MSRRALREDELAGLFARHPQWHVETGRLVREDQVAFATACAWLGQIAPDCDAMDHHPVITVTYDHLRVEVFTHDRDYLTTWDERLVELLDERWPV